jgi:membrane-bound ClpP family serine protease
VKIMARTNERTTLRSLSGVNFLAGLWLLAAPFVLGYSATVTARNNDLLLGTIIVVLAVIGLSMTEESWSRVLNIIAGLWLIVAPFILGYASVTTATWNSIVVGLVVLAFAAWETTVVSGRRHHMAT